MKTLLTVLNVRSAMFLKGITDRSWHGISKNLATVIIFGGVAIGTFLMVRMLTGYMVHQVGVDIFALHRLLCVRTLLVLPLDLYHRSAGQLCHALHFQ